MHERRGGVIAMATAIVKSFNPGRELVIVKLDGRPAGVALRVCGSDRAAVTKMPPGQRIRFDLSWDRHGQVFAIDVVPISPTVVAVDGGRFRGAAQRFDQHNSQWVKPNDDVASGTEAELLDTPVIRRLMQRHGVETRSVRAMIATVARATAKASRQR
jgi:hypothetical protein